MPIGPYRKKVNTHRNSENTDRKKNHRDFRVEWIKYDYV